MRIDETYAYLCVHDTAAAIRFYGQAFGATEKFRLVEPSGRIGHAELAFGPHTVMLCDEFPECGIRSASSLGATPVTLHLHVDDADARPWRPAPRWNARPATRSTASAAAWCAAPSATAG